MFNMSVLFLRLELMDPDYYKCKEFNLQSFYAIWVHDIQIEKLAHVTAATACVANSGNTGAAYSEICAWSIF